MSYAALVAHFSDYEDLPIPIDAVLDWIRENTDHKDIRLHPVGRTTRAFRGACRRTAIPKGAPYAADFDIVTEVLFGEDLDEPWKRLVIAKEVLHVFDPQNQRVNTPDAVRRLIPTIITQELHGAPFIPAFNDHLGAFKAMAVLVPVTARQKLRSSLQERTRTVSEIARYVRLPDAYVDIWLESGDEIEPILCGL